MTTFAILLGFGLLAWGIVVAWRGSLLAGCVTVLALGCCFNFYLVSFEVGPISMTLDRLALLGLVAAYGLGRLLGRCDPKPVGILDAVLIAFVAFLLVSTLTGNWRGSPDFVSPHWRLIAGYLVPAVLYWVARDARLTERALGRLLAAATCFGVYLALTGILEVYQVWPLIFPPQGADPDLGIHFGRARGPMLQSVSYGLYLGMGLLSAWLWLPRQGPAGRVLLAAVLPLFALALALTYTRTVYLAVAAGASVVATLTLPRIWEKLAANAVIVALLVAVFGYYGVLSFHRGHWEKQPAPAASDRAEEPSSPDLPPAQPRTDPLPEPQEPLPQGSWETAENTRASAFMRLSFAYVSWKMFLDRPWLGAGFGQFGEAKAPYLEDSSTTLDLRTISRHLHHIHYLSLLTETGIVGLSLFAVLLGGWAWTAWGLWRAEEAPAWVRTHGVLLLGMLAMYACNWMFAELSFSPIDHGLLFLLTGIAVGLRRQSEAGAPVLAPSYSGASGD